MKKLIFCKEIVPSVISAHSFKKILDGRKCSETGHKVSGLLTRTRREVKSKHLNPVETSVSLHNCRPPAPHWHYHRAAALWALHHRHHCYYMGLLLHVCKSARLWVLSIIMAAGCHTSCCQGHQHATCTVTKTIAFVQWCNVFIIIKRGIDFVRVH